jgi:glycosyltransferase involved in cell wall biosynthesis
VLTEPGDPRALAEAMTAIIRDGERRTRLAAAGPDVAARFTWDRTAAQHAEIYRRLAGERTALAGRAFQ